MREYREISVAGDERPFRQDGRDAGAAPRRPAPRRRPASTDWRGLALSGIGGTVRLCRTQPGSVLGSLAVLGAVTAVCVNALGSQAGRHPAPILPKPALRQEARQEGAARPPLAREAAKPAPERPAEATRSPEPIRTAEARPEPRKDAAKPDPIAALIRSDETTASVSPKDSAVIQAQRALNKLGYGPLKADGLMGPGTRAAIEKFERAAKLPVKGEPAGRTLRELSQKAGQG
ncbi:peptidoglycan-binding domain-containing protein [Methylobacterium gregans]|uniref:Peptidoglycan binding-like domain-containing protein n=1 Tax=Methylobacterium gregans TaxID=374424 RepID=A0AA37M9E5_9HYPH|nr:peptidoglycan-binding domain-containing protein [Methylobacterium gregans]MDQ0523289.1 hypothetical protein [Methylobacterium gregans]GJD77236.1 hypothetical protein NBEOAGPD_0439 [Methylobacterium gregans]GLS53491.1 peptidoglycan-binding protein [Methylobacterium gregans]